MNLKTFLKVRMAVCTFGVLCALGIFALVPGELIQLSQAKDVLAHLGFLLLVSGLVCCPVAMWLLGKLLLSDLSLSLKLRA